MISIRLSDFFEISGKSKRRRSFKKLIRIKLGWKPRIPFAQGIEKNYRRRKSMIEKANILI